MKMVLLTTGSGKEFWNLLYICSGVWGIGMQIGRCGYNDSVTTEEKSMARKEL